MSKFFVNLKIIIMFIFLILCSLHSVTSGVSSRTASPIHIGPVRPSLAESSALLSDSSEDTPTHQRPEVQPQQTQLAKHQFIVSATVHMEAH